MDIFDMIDLIRRRPGMFIGSNSITALFPEKAKGGVRFPKGTESYFGHIDSWEEFTASNISFDKNIVF